MVDRQINVVISSLEGFVERQIKRLTLNVTAELIEDTPVDTGWARANWVPNIGSPFQGTAGTREQAEAGVLDTASQGLGLAQISAIYTLPQGEVYITNNVPYITTLNEGSSAQAPAAFVQAAILRGIRQTLSR